MTGEPVLLALYVGPLAAVIAAAAILWRRSQPTTTDMWPGDLDEIDPATRRLRAARRAVLALTAPPLLWLAFGAALAVRTAAFGIALACVARWLARRESGATAQARRILRRVRRARGDELKGVDIDPPLAVALHGSSAMWLIDPAYASALGVPTHTRTALTPDPRWDTSCG